MSFEPKLQRKAADKILAYVEQTYSTRGEYLLAIEQVRLALIRLAASPKLAVSPIGLFEERPIFRFVLDADGTTREVAVCFCFDHTDPTESVILITDFRPVGPP